MNATHHGEVLTYWLQEDLSVQNTRGNYQKAMDFVSSNGGGCRNITGLDYPEIYTPPNVNVSYIRATEAEFQAIDADPEHEVLWYEPIPEMPI